MSSVAGCSRTAVFCSPISSNETRAFPEAYRDPEGFFTCCTYIVTNVIAYNRKQVRKDEAPKTFEDLLAAEMD